MELLRTAFRFRRRGDRLWQGSSSTFDLRKVTLSHHSEKNVAVSITTKFRESEHLTSISMLSAQGGRLMKKKTKITEKGDYAMRVESGWLVTIGRFAD